MPRLIGAPGHTTLADTQVQGGAIGTAYVPAVLAGRSRWLNELITGTVAPNQEPCAPDTGVGGGAGHDHSGNVSRPLRHTIASWTFGQGPVSPINITNGDAPAVAISGANIVSAYFLGVHSATLFKGRFFHVPIPMCGAPPDGCYNAVALSVLAASDVAFNLHVTAETAGGRVQFSDSFALGLGHLVSADQDQMLPMKPGFYNAFKVIVEAERNGADGTVALLQIALHQVKVSTRVL